MSNPFRCKNVFLLRRLSSERLSEMEYKAILQEVISQVVEEDTKALAHSILGDYNAKMINLQQSQVLLKHVWQHGLFHVRN